MCLLFSCNAVGVQTFLQRGPMCERQPMNYMNPYNNMKCKGLMIFFNWILLFPHTKQKYIYIHFFQNLCYFVFEN